MRLLRQALGDAFAGRVAEAKQALAKVTATTPLEHALVGRAEGLIVLVEGDERRAITLLWRSSEALRKVDALEQAVSERLYGLALIRALREVEGTFALERADATLDALGVAERPTLPEE